MVWALDLQCSGGITTPLDLYRSTPENRVQLTFKDIFFLMINLLFLLKYCEYTILYWFQRYDTVVQHLPTLLNPHLL